MDTITQTTSAGVPLHTPGPWTVGYQAMDVTGISAKGPFKVCDIRGWGHLTGKGSGALGLPYPEAAAIQYANAYLIAAAPDMLAALRNVQKLISEAAMNGFNWKNGDWADRLFASQHVTDTAIRRAENRELRSLSSRAPEKS